MEIDDEQNQENALSKPAQEGELTKPISTTNDLIEALDGDKSHKYMRLIATALSSLPWVSGLIALSAEMEQEKINGLLKLYVEEQEPRYRDLEKTLIDITSRLDNFDDSVTTRLESPEYLSIVRRAFRAWDNAETEEKREYIKKLIINAAVVDLCPDDLIRLFIDWIENYHEAHFAVIKEIYKTPGITKAAIWDNLNNAQRAKEDSAEAGLYRYLLRELSMGGIIEQAKERDGDGRTYRATPKRSPRGSGSKLTESTYEDTKPQVLTQLGQEFIHYVLNDAVKRINADPSQ